MNRACGLAAEACAAALLFASCTADSSQRFSDWRHNRVESANRGMSDWANLSADMMVDKYGPPDRVETYRLVWEHRGPWKKIMVWDEGGFFQTGGAAILEGTIAYAVPADKRVQLASFSRGLYVSADGAELSARSAGEDRDFLMLNLADQIVKGERSPEEARVDYLLAIRLSESGKASPSMQRLLFQ